MYCLLQTNCNAVALLRNTIIIFFLLFTEILFAGVYEDGKFLVRLCGGQDSPFRVVRVNGSVTIKRTPRSSRDDLDLSFRRQSIQSMQSSSPQKSLYTTTTSGRRIIRPSLVPDAMGPFPRSISADHGLLKGNRFAHSSVIDFFRAKR